MPPALQIDEETIIETTGLLAATPPLKRGTKAKKPDNSLAIDIDKSNNARECNSNCKQCMHVYKRTMLCLTVMVIALLLSILVIITSSTNNNSSSSSIANANIHGNSKIPSSDRFPLSLLHPVQDLGLSEFDRSPEDSSFPSFYHDYIGDGDGDGGDGGDTNNRWKVLNSNDKRNTQKALPTNAWYQNLLQVSRDDEPSNLQRAYPVPYLLDVVGVIPGLRIHATDTITTDMVMQLSFNENFGLVIGATEDLSSLAGSGQKCSHRYKVRQMTELGITLEWFAMKMKSNIVRGTSFITMEYEKQQHGTFGSSSSMLLPTIASQSELFSSIIIDGTDTTLDCSNASGPHIKKVRVEKDIELYFRESDYTWMVFFSEPSWIQCSVETGKTYIQVVDYDYDHDYNYDKDGPHNNNCYSDTLILRAALIDQCTTGSNVVSCRKGLGNRLPDEPVKDAYANLLRAHVDMYPGSDTSFTYAFHDDLSGSNDIATLSFDWDARNMSDLCNKKIPSSYNSTQQAEILVFALSHHMDRLPDVLPNNTRYCKSSITGPACLVTGNTWNILQQLPKIGFRAKRPPKPQYIPTLGNTLSLDLCFKLPDYFKRGAGDTYFSGKYLAKLARILLIAEEVIDLCDKDQGREYQQFCKNATIPTEDQMKNGIVELRESVEVWINGSAETPFVYDKSWGGVVSCGCYMEGTECINRYPNCPGFTDPGLNFGNGFYNDHHFHYGYHIFAAAVVSHFDNVWAMDNFENVLLLVRDIANPSENDLYFPLFRHKDWFQGSSWASGIPYPAYLNGKNQESSSEAIAAYEGVALFGKVMHVIWEEANHKHYAAVSNQIAYVGTLLAGTELVSTKRYWHVKSDKDPQRVYPSEFNKHVVGILWQTMAQFGTWFGTKAYLPIGIQLLPLTPISEDRDDDLDWVNSIYKPLTAACATDFQCTQSGWSILQLAVLATIGYASEAATKMKELPDESFENAGGNGHSRSNTIWYIATRPDINRPIPLSPYDKRGEEDIQPKAMYDLSDCYRDTCTEDVLDREAGEYTCRVRISWLIHENGLPQWEACRKVAGVEFPTICGPCDPGANFVSKEKRKEESEIGNEQQPVEVSIVSNSLRCLPCTKQECESELNRCPMYKKTFVCTEGTSRGDCSEDIQFWVEQNECDSCCEMTNCVVLKDKEAKKLTNDGNALSKNECPPCEPSICYGELSHCPIHTAPFLCTVGASKGGCASKPWNLSDNIDCMECCELKIDC